ncbi:primase-helicase family protein [uncultured Mesonia sp.]|uniref:primase-helicase family protein n=1 Tax=uncultured Mesonia sp. TaxID=399731 RepID=UPI00374E808B
MKNRYLRIQTNYYKIVDRPNLDGTTTQVLTKWQRKTILEDHGKEFLKDIPKYDGFVTKPSHVNYQLEIGTHYNNYHKIEGDVKQGNFETTESFLKQIFKDQYPLFLDYLSLLWCKPLHILPILCLVSKERETGKTTFLNWIKSIFQQNMKILRTEDLRSNFNSDWADRLIIAIDEAKFAKPSDSEIIKNLSTARHSNKEGKGKDRYEIPFFGKFIITSNHNSDFVLIDPEEIRYWVVELEKPTFKIADFEEKLKAELPAIKYYIQNRKIRTKPKGRMWFSKEDIHTEALDRVVKGSNMSLEKEFAAILLHKLEDVEVEEIKFTLTDIQDLLKERFVTKTFTQIKQVIENKWGLTVSSNSTSYSYYRKIFNEYRKEWEVIREPRKGRVYTFHKELLERL